MFSIVAVLVCIPTNSVRVSRPCRKRRPSAREDGGVSGVSSSCGARALRPLRGLQETRVATREESGFLGFTWRRGLTPRVSSPAKSEGDRENTNPFFSSHLVSPKSPFPGAVSLLLFRELARHNNGNQTPNQTCPPCAPSSCSPPPPPPRAPPACPPAGCPPGESGLVSRRSKGLHSPLESRRVSLGAH